MKKLAMSPQSMWYMDHSILTVLNQKGMLEGEPAPWAEGVVSSEVYFGCESWTIKKAEGRRIDAFELWCWRRLLRVPWTARRSNRYILKEISPEYSLEGLMLKLKLQLKLNTLAT